MMLEYSNTLVLGILAFVSLVTTFILGILMRKGKPVFKYHRFFAFLTLVLALIYAYLVLFWK
ncbi:hypothetical protein J4233_03800 [Candidatus Pacearchaeota archaeon]|nr:hypothetical protein [Candidatus Pacearchaeota archaeon]